MGMKGHGTTKRVYLCGKLDVNDDQETPNQSEPEAFIHICLLDTTWRKEILSHLDSARPRLEGKSLPIQPEVG